MILLKKGQQWRWEALWHRGAEYRVLTITLPCKHDVEIIPGWIDRTGRIMDRTGCTSPGCRRVFEDMYLEEWPS